MHYNIWSTLVLAATLTSNVATAQILVEDSNSNQAPVYENTQKPKTGEGAARQYFNKRENNRSESTSYDSGRGSQGERYMAIQIGSFVNDTAYRWGDNRKNEDVGEMILGVSYRIGEWVNSADLLARIEFTQFDIDGESPKKLSFMPIISFPDVKSGFPLYFGGGAGLGVFLKQLSDESSLVIDYNLHLGARFMDMFPSGGVLIETGLRGDIHLIGSGQFDGVYVSVGGAFTF